MSLNNAIRLGVVSAVYPATYTCDVYFEDQDVTIPDLTIGCSGTRNRDFDLPNVDDLALCVLIPPSLCDGFVVAFGYNDVDLPPEASESEWMKLFADGSVIKYSKGTIEIISKGAVNIKGASAVKVESATSVSITGAAIDLTAPNINVNGNLMVNKKPYDAHTHSAGTYIDSLGKAVTGMSGAVS